MSAISAVESLTFFVVPLISFGVFGATSVSFPPASYWLMALMSLVSMFIISRMYCIPETNDKDGISKGSGSSEILEQRLLNPLE